MQSIAPVLARVMPPSPFPKTSEAAAPADVFVKSVTTERTRQLPHPADGIVSTQPLGPLYTPQRTTFRVYAPTASRLQIHLYTTPVGGEARILDMTRNADGTWETAVTGDCASTFYTYTAAGSDPGFHPDRELTDPYAPCVTNFDGRSRVINDETPIAPRPQFPQQDAIIYEMHLRDFTIDPDSGIQRRGKYLGLTEGGTHLAGRPDVSTGLDHLRDLGVNTVQLMPILEFNSDKTGDKYGWGYDSALYNTPDGWYASERLDGSRVKETKQMVDALHRRGIRVVLDVVFNHISEEVRQRCSSFEGLVPGYYFRRKEDGSPWNGSACGNEFRSEAPMARRFIKDSLKHWVTDYKVDGFRFDLMGLIDLQTMKEAATELHAIDPNLLIYGEPWAAGETPIDVTGKGKQRGLQFGVFNDNFRDALKGDVFHPQARGFLQAGDHRDAVKQGIKGSVDDFASAPTESINYVECHDNATFWDRLKMSTADDGSVTDGDRRAMDKMGAAVLMTSQGIPFIQTGQEFLRSKGGDDNSFDKPDSVNMIHWHDKVENRDVFDYYAGMIALRKAHPLFHLATADQVHAAVQFLDSDRTLGYVIQDVTGRDSWKRAAVFLNPSRDAQDLTLPDGNWQTFSDGSQARTASLDSNAVSAHHTVHVPGRAAVVLGEPR